MQKIMEFVDEISGYEAYLFCQPDKTTRPIKFNGGTIEFQEFFIMEYKNFFDPVTSTIKECVCFSEPTTNYLEILLKFEKMTNCKKEK